MNGESLNIQQDNLAKLRMEFPNLFTEGKLDWEKLKATFSEDINFANERYVLNWAGKSDAFKVLQVPTTATLKPIPEDSINFDTSENIFIEGENLEVLKILQKSYYNKIKCIEIDPPYNTGNDSFIYPDSFKESKEEYQKRIGEKDSEGFLMKEGMFRKNSKDSGHYHSNWLSMMYPRLFLAKNLLKDDGVIFVHIDDNEVHNLRLLMNEIFGEENFLLSIIWHRRQNADNRNENFASNDHEYILAYSKNSTFTFKGKEIDLTKYKNPDNDPRGPWASIDLSGLATKAQRPNLHYDLIDPKTGNSFPPNPTRGWSKSPSTTARMIENNEIIFPSNPNGRPRQKKFLNDLQSTSTGFSSILNKEEVGFTTDGTQEFSELFENRYFPFPKPVDLIKKLIQQSTTDDDIVLDFFAGSGTLSQAILELNKEDSGRRRFILVQLPELCDIHSEAYKAGYRTIADISKERIRRVIKNLIKRKNDLQESIPLEQKKIEDFQVKLKELTTSSNQLFNIEKQNHEVEKIKNLITQIEVNRVSSEEEMMCINSMDKGFKVFRLSPSNFKIWRSSEINEGNVVQQLEAFTDPVQLSSSELNMLYELILKAGYQLIDKVEETSNYFTIANGELIIALQQLDAIIIHQILIAKPTKVITLDNLFKGNDQLKTNTVLQMKDAGIDFKTI